jgi:hypothetical protein
MFEVAPILLLSGVHHGLNRSTCSFCQLLELLEFDGVLRDAAARAKARPAPIAQSPSGILRARRMFPRVQVGLTAGTVAAVALFTPGIRPIPPNREAGQHAREQAGADALRGSHQLGLESPVCAEGGTSINW